MRRILGFGGLALVALACSSQAADDKDSKKSKDSKGTVVELDGLRSKTPSEWKQERPANRMRYRQFQLPKIKGDPNDADLVIYRNLGGNVKANIARWKRQFQPPRGKTIDEVSKVKEITIAGRKATYLDIHGTFRPPPFDPKYRGKKQEKFRMLAIQFQGPKNLYHIKLTGPAPTIEHYKKGFDAWLKGFKKPS